MVKNDLSKTIRRSMEEKTTEELLQIWQKNDRTEYTEAAFGIIRQILNDRGDKPPPQLLEGTKEEESSPASLLFRTMISGTIIEMIYVLGAAMLFITGIERMTGNQMWPGITIIIVGNLLWRLLCEGWILFFSMHDKLDSMSEELKKANRNL